MVKVTIGRGSQLESAEADLIQSLVINTESLVRVLNELMHREGGIVRLDDGIGDLKSLALEVGPMVKQRRSNQPWAMERRRKCTSFYRGTPP